MGDSKLKAGEAAGLQTPLTMSGTTATAWQCGERSRCPLRRSCKGSYPQNAFPRTTFRCVTAPLKVLSSPMQDTKFALKTYCNVLECPVTVIECITLSLCPAGGIRPGVAGAAASRWDRLQCTHSWRTEAKQRWLSISFKQQSFPCRGSQHGVRLASSQQWWRHCSAYRHVVW